MAHYITRECVSCDACLEQCPTESIVKGETTYLIDSDTCTDCRACVPVCPVSAIKKQKLEP